MLIQTLAVLFLGAALDAQTPGPLPVEVSLDPQGDQVQAAVVIDRADRILVAWRDSSSRGERILAQGFDRLGGRLGPAVPATAAANRKASHPDLALDFNGRAVLSWNEIAGATQSIYFRRFSMTGETLESLPLPQPDQRVIIGSLPAVAVDSAGNLVLVWQDRRQGRSGIFGTWFAYDDSLGTVSRDSARFAWLGEVRVNESEEGQQSAPDVAADRKGNFLVAWRDSRPDSLGDSLGVFCRVFATGGRALTELRLTPAGAAPMAELSAPAVASAGLSAGLSTFLIAWVQANGPVERTLYLARVSLNTFGLPEQVSADPTPIEARVSPGLSLERPSLAAIETGVASLVWSEGTGGDSQVYGVNFNLSDRTPTGGDQLTQPDPGFGTPARRCASAVRPNGRYVVIWEDLGGADVDLRMQSYNQNGISDEPFHISPAGRPAEDSRNAAMVGREAGGFSIIWENRTENGADLQSSDFDISGRSLGPAGPLSPVSGEQHRPVAAQNSQGAYLVAWEERLTSGYRIRAMLFRAAGTVLKNAFIVEEHPANNLSGIAAGLDENGQASLVWERWAPLSDAPDLVLARLDSLGNRIGSTVIVAPASSGGPRLASVAVAPNGNRMVVWRQGGTQSSNAFVAGKVYSAGGAILQAGIRVSREGYYFLGSVGRPVVMASRVTGNFLVLWQEFTNDRQKLYYSLFSPAGDSLIAGSDYRHQLETATKGSGIPVAQTSPAVAVDESGHYLAVWIEKAIGAPPRLLGHAIDSLGSGLGSIFQVPGVASAALPEVGILGGTRIVLAWQDTVGASSRILAQIIDLELFQLQGLVLSASRTAYPVFVQIDGNVRDSAVVNPAGGFAFRSLTAGAYRLWLSVDGQSFEAARRSFTLSHGQAGSQNLGVVADLAGSQGPAPPLDRGPVLAQNEPNPFNPSTTITFRITSTGRPVPVSLLVYDLRGGLVKSLFEGELETGSFTAQWDGRDEQGRGMPSGVFFYRLKAGAEIRVRKMVLLK